MKRRILTIIIALGWLLPLSAQVITIGECVRLAREHYPLVAQYGVVERLAGLDLSDISKAWLPQGTVGAQVTWQNDVAALPDVLTRMLAQNGVEYPGLDKTQYRVGIDVAQQIWDGGRSRASRKVAETSSAVETAALDVQLYELEARVEEIYFSILLLEERITRTDKSIALVDSTLSQVRSMFRNGVAMQSDCDQIEARLLALRQQKTTLTASRESLGRILGIFIGTSPGDRKLVLPAEDALPYATDINPQNRLFDRTIANLTALEAGVKSSLIPTVGAFASAYYGYPGYNMFRNMQTRDLSFNFMAGIKIGWNFGVLYTRRNSLDRLRLRRDRVEVERAIFNFNNDVAMTESMGKIAALREVMRDDERIVRLRSSVMAAARSQLRNGVIDATALLTKLTDEELAENDLSQHRIELVKAIYNLNHLKNK